MSTILITGGTGLVGTALRRYLSSKGHQIIILTRDASRHPAEPSVEFAEWDIKKQSIDVAAVQKADHIIHLAGASVFDHRWTAAYKKELEESRTLSSKLLVDTLKKYSHSVKSVVSSSAIGWYGEDKKDGHFFTEEEKAADNFLGHICQLWESSIEPITSAGPRLVIMRTGIVLSNEGGFLAPIQQGMRFGMAIITGSGKQIISWIHIEDLCRMFLHAIGHQQLSGPYNAVAPAPVSMKELVLKQGRLTKGSFYIPIHAPAFALKIALGERSVEALKSTTVSAEKIKNAGFNFLFPGIDAALQSLKNDKKL
ncbi:MAG: TIGR01777 family protein [Chitinophagaceae bacterium]|nr:MAG: TIGR01777 family protein [Chitinophagaceae bacterium]